MDGDFWFWRHLGRRATPITLEAARLRLTGRRTVGLVEMFWLNRGCTILECASSPDGVLSIALLHGSDIAEVEAALR